MTGFAEVAEQLRDGSDFESELRTAFAKCLERMNRLETKVKKQGNLINKLQSVVDSLQAKRVREPGGQTSQTCLRSAGRKRRHSYAEQEGNVGVAEVKPPPHDFVLFCQSIRPELRADRRSAAEQTKVAGETWEAMSIEEKAPFP